MAGVAQDGFAFLEAYDTNGDGVIDARDPAFASLRVWRDLDGDGVSDEGELKTLPEHGIVSLALTRTAVDGDNQGHRVGFEARFTRADGTTGASQSIYFATDRQDTRADHTPDFTPADGVNLLPLLPGSGMVKSIAYKASLDPAFRADWTALTDTAAQKGPAELREAFTALLLRWAGVEGTAPDSRGPHVDARHLAFLEAFLGEGYREVIRGATDELRTTRHGLSGWIWAAFAQRTCWPSETGSHGSPHSERQVSRPNSGFTAPNPTSRCRPVCAQSGHRTHSGHTRKRTRLKCRWRSCWPVPSGAFQNLYRVCANLPVRRVGR